MLRILSLAALLLFIAPGLAGAEPDATPPQVVLHGIPFSLEVEDPELGPGESREVQVLAGTRETAVTLSGPGPVSAEGIFLEPGDNLSLRWDSGGKSLEARSLPGWSSLAPPLLAILLAIIFRQAVLALLTGVWVGAMLVYRTDPFTAFLRSIDHYVLGSLTDTGNVQLLLFTFAMGGMLGVVSRSGGTHGIVDLVTPHARTPRSGQLSSWVMGLAVFFDDYANTLLVGNTMRSITDKLRISREKLSYIVDSTAAPVASIAIISTWIGVEVGLIGDAFADVGIERDAFGAFVASLPYRFYPIFALVFGFMVASSGRDFGPMLKAERRARTTGDVLRPGSAPLANLEGEHLEPTEGKPKRWINAAVPLAVMVVSILVFLYTTGKKADPAATDLKTILGNADSYAALLWASFLASAAALLMAIAGRVLSINEAVAAWVAGAKSILMAAVILTLAWSISEVSGNMHTADYLVNLLGESLNPHWLPMLVFVLSGFTSFATGSSWGTMGILIPLVIPLAHSLAPGNEAILVGTISSVLAGSVWGDHCSPISDTTVLSSMACSVDHMDHVNTQLPYALFVAGVAIVVGEIPTAFGLPYWVSWVVGILIMGLWLRVVGKKSGNPAIA